jgi:arginase
MTDALNTAVGTAVSRGRFPFVYGGDCSSLLGIVTSLRDARGEVGLVFIDGHEDTTPPELSEDGEAADTEIGLLRGLTGQLMKGPLTQRLPALRFDALAMLGSRDQRWRSRFNRGVIAGPWSVVALGRRSHR